MHTQLRCYCGSNRPFDSCCQPLINGTQTAHTPEQLMRSRYSAYANGDFDYVLATYGVAQRNSLSLQDIEQASHNTQWLKLEILDTWVNANVAEVEFNAFYQCDKQLFKLHERSQFCREDAIWRYITGTHYSDSGKYQQLRNNLCLCASGKKYKKCCALIT